MLTIVLNVLVVVLSVLAIVAGLYVAHLWLKASKVEIQPDKEALERTKDPAFIALAHARAAREAWEEAGKLNSQADIWTAIPVAAQALVTIGAWHP